MIERLKRGWGRDLNNKIQVALEKKRKIENDIVLLNKSYKEKELNYSEYKGLLNDFKKLDESYSNYIDECKVRILRGEIREESNFVRNFPVMIIVLLLAIALILPMVIEVGTITGAAVIHEDKYYGKKIVDGPLEITFEKIEQTSEKLILELSHNSNKSEMVFIEGKVDYVLDKDMIEPGETARLEIDLIQGIVPEFKLHVGSKQGTFSVSGVGSEIYAMGKTIPLVLTNGEYSLVDRNDEKINVEIFEGKSWVVIKGVSVSLIEVQIGEFGNEKIKTWVLAAEPVSMEEAKITLEKKGEVNVVLECDEIDLVTRECVSEWEETNIPFTDNGNSITFFVDHFSGYAGGWKEEEIVTEEKIIIEGENITGGEIFKTEGFGVQHLNPSTAWDGNLIELSFPAAVAGDLNGDGWDDIVLTGQEGAGVYINNGTTLNLKTSWGSITTLHDSANALADFDNDGDLDYLQIGDDAQWAFEVYLNNGTALNYDASWTPGSRTAITRVSLEVGDIDNDGDYDIIANGDNGAAPSMEVYLNSGSGFSISFSWAAGFTYISDNQFSNNRLILADFDEDCKLDLVAFGVDLGSGEKITKFYKNYGTTFTEDITWGGNLSMFSYALSGVGDVDNDGDLDLVVTGDSYTDTSDTCDVSDTCDTITSTCAANYCTPALVCCDGFTPCGPVPGPNDPACVGAGAGSCCSGFFPPEAPGCWQNSNCNYCKNQGAPSGSPSCSDMFGGTGSDSDCWACTVGGGKCPAGLDFECWIEGYQGFVYNNTGTALIESQSIIAVRQGSLVLGDVNNDGYLDLWITGENSTGGFNGVEQALYINDGSGQFSINSTFGENISARYQGVTAFFNDFDNDTKLDLFVAGNFVNKTDWCNLTNQVCDMSDTCDGASGFCNNNPAQSCPSGLDSECYFCSISGEYFDCSGGGCDPYTCVYSNQACNNQNSTCWASSPKTDIYMNNFGTVNTKPNASLNFTTSYSGGKLCINWSAGSDAETAAAGLYYNVRVGTSSGGNEILSGYNARGSNPTQGYFGNLMTKNFLNLSIGEQKLYWSVQTIDTALGVSVWSAEQLHNYTVTCGNKDDDIVLTENLDANQTNCLNITVDDVIIDCADYTIDGNNSFATAIKAVGLTGIQIKNCNFINFTGSDIEFINTNYSLIENVDVIINITNSTGDNVTNSDVSELYITDSTDIFINNSIVNYTEIITSTTIDIETSTMRNYSLTNVTFLSLKNDSQGKVTFLENVTESGTNMFGNSTSDIIWQNFLLTVDSANEPGFNVSANVSVYNVLYAWPRMYVNLSTNFTLCNSTTDPSCVNLSYSSNTFTFNISHFTSFQVREGAYLVANSTPVQNLPKAGLDPTLVLLRINSDNHRDIHLTGYDGNSGQYHNNIYFDDGNGNYNGDGITDTLLTGVAYSGVAWGDYDLDNDSDLVYCGYNGGWVGHAFKNNGDSVAMTQDAGSSSNITDVIYCSTAMGDWDNDGDLDLAVQGMTSGFVADCAIYNNTNGTFILHAMSSNCTGKYHGALTWMDVNNDSWVDLVSLGYDGTNNVFEILINQNGTNFKNDSTWAQNLVGQRYARLAIGDLDNNGLRDMVVHGNASSGPRTYWYNNTGSTFEVVSNHDMYNVTRGAICLTDFNSDGYRDVYMTGNDETLGILGVYQKGVWLNQNNGGSLSYSQAYSYNLTGLFWATCFTVPGSSPVVWVVGNDESDVTHTIKHDNTGPTTDTAPTIGDLPPIVNISGNIVTVETDPGADDSDDKGLNGTDIFYVAEKDNGQGTANFLNAVQGGSNTYHAVGSVPYGVGWIYVDDNITINKDISYYLGDGAGNIDFTDVSNPAPTVDYIEVNVEDMLIISVSDTSGDCSISSDQSKGLVPGETSWCNSGNWSTGMSNLAFNVTVNFQKFNANLTINNTFDNSTVYAGFVNYTNATSTGHILADGWNLSSSPGTDNSSFDIVRNFTGYQTVPFTSVRGAGIYWAETQGQKSIIYTVEVYPCTPSTC